MKPLLTLLLSLFIFFSHEIANALGWANWVNELRQEAISQGIDPDLFDQLFDEIPEPDRHVMRSNHNQPEHRMTYPEYRNTRADQYKISIGRKEYQKHKTALEKIGRAYQVDPCYIVAIWGIETSYGRYMGKFPVIRSLATLAYDSNRKEKFRSELLYALHMLNEGQVDLNEFKGEWAGASGQSQFLPSSWFKYAVDFDNCGRKNIWTSYADVFASIANYMIKNNWNDDEPLAVPVILPRNFDIDLIGKTIVKPVNYWNTLGVRTTAGHILPYPNLQASIVRLDGGPTFLAYPNFKVLLRYNNSSYYAGTVRYMANAICQHI